jgi:hypothetical protein
MKTRAEVMTDVKDVVKTLAAQFNDEHLAVL